MRSACLLIAILFISGCYSNRSISYYGSGYNRSYTGEMSQIAFLQGVSSEEAKVESGQFIIDQGSRVMLIQSGQSFPDQALIDAIGKRFIPILVSGNPEIGGTDIGDIRLAARAGSVDYIMAYWGNIRNTREGTVYVQLSAIVANVSTGTWMNYAVESDAVPQAYSFFNPQRADDIQVGELKKKTYTQLVEKIFGETEKR